MTHFWAKMLNFLLAIRDPHTESNSGFWYVRSGPSPLFWSYNLLLWSADRTRSLGPRIDRRWFVDPCLHFWGIYFSNESNYIFESKSEFNSNKVIWVKSIEICSLDWLGTKFRHMLDLDFSWKNDFTDMILLISTAPFQSKIYFLIHFV